MPAASEAMMVENGFVVEHIVPTEVPKKIQANPTIASYLAAINTGIKIGKKAKVSSAKPKVVPPMATKVVVSMIKIYSRPFSLFTSQKIPASNAPVKLIMPINPPIINTKNMMSDAEAEQ